MIELKRVTIEDKDKLFHLLEFALYDGSFYIDNIINDDCLFEYNWFDSYFTEETRESFFIKYNNKIAGFVMINQNLKVLDNGYSIAEFLILPYYRSKHIGKESAYKVFQLHDKWEVQPMENNNIAYNFWKNIIKEYTNNNYEINTYTNMEDIFVLKKKK